MMEECPPGGVCASGECDPSKSDKPVGDQAQPKRVSRGDEVSQAASHSPELKRRKVSDNQHHLKLFRKYVSRKAAGKGIAVLEGVGLDSETITACFSSHPLNEEEAVQAGLTKWCGGQGNEPSTWQVLFAAMEYAKIAQQHIHDLKNEPGLFGTQCVTEPITEQREAVTGETDKSPKKDCRSSTKEAATFSTGFNIPLLDLVALVVISSIMFFLVLQGPSSDQKAVARYRVEEEAKKGLKGETSVVPDQVTGGPTATTTGCQAQTQSAVPGQVTGGPTAAARGSQPPTQVAVSPVIKAAKFGKVAAVRKLLDEGAATVEDRDENGSNALHIAAIFGHLELVKFLIPIFGEKKFAVNHSGDTCLTLAIKHEEEDIVEYIPHPGGRIWQAALTAVTRPSPHLFSRHHTLCFHNRL